MNAQTKIETPTTLLGALPLALASVGTAMKDSANPHFKSKYADLASVLEAIRPIADHGIWFRQSAIPTDMQGVLLETFYVGHGEELSAGQLFVPVNKNDAQALGSAMTYARRYALSLAFGVAADDDEGNAAAKSVPKVELAADADVAQIMQLCQAVGDGQEQRICKAFDIPNLKALPAARVAKVISQLQDKLADKAKAETNARAETVDA